MPENAVVLTGSDTIQIDDRILADLADGDCVTIAAPDDLAVSKPGKNGNTIFAYKETGRMVDATLRILRGSPDDKYLQARLQEMKNGFSDFILLTGVFTKRTGDGKGNIASDVYQMSGGIFKKQPGAKTSSEGDSDQSVTEYILVFGNNDRSIQ